MPTAIEKPLRRAIQGPSLPAPPGRQKPPRFAPKKLSRIAYFGNLSLRKRPPLKEMYGLSHDERQILQLFSAGIDQPQIAKKSKCTPTFVALTLKIFFNQKYAPPVEVYAQALRLMNEKRHTLGEIAQAARLSETSMGELNRIFSVLSPTIIKKIHRRKTAEANSIPAAEEEQIKAYLRRGLSFKKIRKLTGRSAAVFKRIMRKFAIRSKEEQKKIRYRQMGETQSELTPMQLTAAKSLLAEKNPVRALSFIEIGKALGVSTASVITVNKREGMIRSSEEIATITCFAKKYAEARNEKGLLIELALASGQSDSKILACLARYDEVQERSVCPETNRTLVAKHKRDFAGLEICRKIRQYVLSGYCEIPTSQREENLQTFIFYFTQEVHPNERLYFAEGVLRTFPAELHYILQKLNQPSVRTILKEAILSRFILRGEKLMGPN